MFLCSTRSETATCSALCSFQSLAKLLLLQTVELNLQRVLLGQLKKKKNKKKKRLPLGLVSKLTELITSLTSTCGEFAAGSNFDIFFLFFRRVILRLIVPLALQPYSVKNNGAVVDTTKIL